MPLYTIHRHAVIAAAGIPVYRVRAQEAYEPAELAQHIDRLIADADKGAR
jgi:hypothetical protein